MAGHLGLFAVGVVIGVSIALLFGKPHSGSDKVTDSAPTSSWINELLESQDSAQPAVTDSNDEPHVAEPISEDESNVSVSGTTMVDNPVRIPSVYKALVGPIPPPRLDSAEVHALFAKEPRDEPWAYAMEAGINNHIANFGAGDGVVVEYVECRSRYCEIAGFTQEDNKHNFSYTLEDIRRSGWWQAAGGSHYFGGQHDGVDRFVIIVSRYNED